MGLHYKNHWGFTVVLFMFQDYSVPDAAFRNYISAQYPGYFLSEGVQGHTYTLYNINYRLSYRFQRERLFTSPNSSWELMTVMILTHISS